MKYLLSVVMGTLIFWGVNLYAAGNAQTIRLEETVLTTRFYTKIDVLEDTGFGQGGVPVTQTHTFESESVVDERLTNTQQERSDHEITQALRQNKAVQVKVIGKPHRMETLQKGEYLSEVRKTVTLVTTHPGLELSMEGAEILVGRDHKQRLKLLIGLKNLTHQPLSLTQNSFKEGDFLLEQTSSSTEKTLMVIGSVIYDLPKIDGSYTLDIPTL